MEKNYLLTDVIGHVGLSGLAIYLLDWMEFTYGSDTPFTKNYSSTLASTYGVRNGAESLDDIYNELESLISRDNTQDGRTYRHREVQNYSHYIWGQNGLLRSKACKLMRDSTDPNLDAVMFEAGLRYLYGYIKAGQKEECPF